MSVRAKLLVIILFVALVPLGVSVYSTLRIHQRAFDDKLGELHQKTAEFGADRLSSYLDQARKSLTNLATTTFDWSELGEAERSGALAILYAQLDDISVVSLLDQHGNGLGTSLYRPPGDPSRPSHPTIALEGLDGFGKRIPFPQAIAGGTASGEPFAVAGDDAATVPLAFAVPGADDKSWVVAVGLSLRGVCATLDRTKPPGTTVLLVGRHHRSLCASPTHQLLEPIDPNLIERMGSAKRNLRYRSQAGVDLLATVARGGDVTVVVEQPAETALETSRAIRRQSLLWIALGVVAALVAGLFLGREITRPARELARGAQAVAKRDFDVRLPEHGKDELAEAARAFNAMSAEIQAWSETLQQRVDDRTRELKEAQEQLLEARKIGAVAAMGAGIAHEINNPLTGVLALAQVLGARAAKAGDEKQQKLLASIEKEALRIRDIVQRTLRLSQDYAGAGFRSLPPGKVVNAVLAAAAPRIADAAIDVDFDCPDDLPAILCNPGQLEEALGQIVDNALQAMTGPRQRLSIAVSSLEGELVKLEVTDNGRGIAPEHLEKVFEPFFTTKTAWSGQGLGLSVAYRIIEAHHGTMRISSQLGRGTTVSIRLPVARQGSYLV